MAVLKGGEIDRFLAKPDPARPIVLVYGPDFGLVAERGRLFAKAIASDLDDPFSVVRIDGDVLAADPARLADEAATVAMFGPKRLIWVRAGDKPIANALSPLLQSPPADAAILIEAGDLKKTSPLRAEAEKSPHAAVLPCYADEGRDLARVIAEETAAAGLTIDGEARDLLMAMLGGDRAASRAEIRKLCLYAHGTGAITAADVAAIAGESLALGLDEIIDAAAGGRADELDRLLMRASQSGLAAQQLIAAMSRHIAGLHKARTAMEKGGGGAAAALAQFQPPLFFRRRAEVERQLGLWTAERLLRFVTRLAEATFETRVKPDLAEAITARTFMAVALAARARNG